MKEQFQEVVKQLLKTNLDINSLLKTLLEQSHDNSKDFSDFNIRFEELMTIKNALINGLKQLKNTNKKIFANLKEAEFKEIWVKIEKLENENFEMINNCKSLLSKEITNAKTHSKVISSYKANREVKPRLFDDLG